VIGQLEDLMSRKVCIPKYLDSSSLVVDVYINKNLIQTTLIDIEVVVNVMKNDTMLKLYLREVLRHTPTIL